MLRKVKNKKLFRVILLFLIVVILSGFSYKIINISKNYYTLSSCSGGIQKSINYSNQFNIGTSLANSEVTSKNNSYNHVSGYFSVSKIPTSLDKFPIADAGRDSFINIGTKIKLNAEKSYDPENQPLSYYWYNITSDSEIFISNSCKFDLYVKSSGVFSFKLKVSDGKNFSEDTVNFSAVILNEISDSAYENPYIIDENDTLELILNKEKFNWLVPMKSEEASAAVSFGVVQNKKISDTIVFSLKLMEVNLKNQIKQQILNKNIDFSDILQDYFFDVKAKSSVNDTEYHLQSEVSVQLDQRKLKEDTYIRNNYQNLAWTYVDDTGLIHWNELIPLDLYSDTVLLPHLSYWILAPINTDFFLAKSSMNLISVYPNPFKPYDGKESTGKIFDGTPNSGVYFKVPSTENLSMKVFDISGKKIESFNFNTKLKDKVQWDCKLASGVYFIYFKSEFGKKVIKFAVVR